MSKYKLILFSRVLWLTATIVFVTGIWIAWSQQAANKSAEGSTSQNINDTSNEPSTDKPDRSEFDAYQVAPDAPRYIFISKLAAEAIVKPMGLTAQNQIEAPVNVFHAGWYTKSAKPGHTGAMVVDGHVSSRHTQGIFSGLKDLKGGDSIIIVRGDNQKINYKVVKSQVYDADRVDMTAVLKPVNPQKSGLNLITCAGTVIKGTHQFDKRIVVFAEQM
ncbi:MAG TPA: sortase [Patescibacteria group bacterium]|nr:sortase [Patescibacteria group bacterium]